ncbi:OVARIAN TUMOR DOMAIN-containing deubiquitinating enzyme 7-like [Haliotis rufescens]|uniref:OVARIAN TUMOR DOMAIN-containing deubiquitinating enzyme 7-like n=1 Tax=Haliotis rufescens TaxID=6454 RepID=UPI00201F39ED|nr:OVARIAN TUMOR DOMAIN-containing deubiquitinating enzyme 7-like [Haliotis rufescens]
MSDTDEDQPSHADHMSDTDSVKYNKTSDLQYFNPVDHEWQTEKAKVVAKRPRSGKKHPTFVCLPVLAKPSKIEPMRGDGNCYFRAISQALFGVQKYHLSVRNANVTLMVEHHEQIKKHFGESYLENSGMDIDGKWATEVEILSTAAILNTNIQIWSKSGSSMKWLCYKSETLGQVSMTEKCIYLCNNSGVHFDYVTYTGQ